MASAVLYIAAALVALFYWIYNRINFDVNYWKKKGVPQLESEFFFGDAKAVGPKCIGEQNLYFYKEFKKRGFKHGGYSLTKYRFWMPIDRDLIKTILVKDFNHFSAHFPKPKSSIFYDNLFHMDGETWKDMRRKLTPTFTSGKMKMMYEIVLGKTDGLCKLVNEMVEYGEPTEIKALLARFTTDVIGSCGFGVECSSIEDINSDFYRHGQMIFDEVNKPRSKLRMMFALLGLTSSPVKLDVDVIENFFSNVVKETLEYREKNKIIRKDFVHLMIQLKNKGVVTEVTNDGEDVYQKTVNKDAISMYDIIGQCLLFFTAGFETTSTTMSYALLELTQNQDVQKKMREEVRAVLKKHDGKFSYEAIQQMTYVENVIEETLRKYPPVTILPRTCTKTYKLPNSDVVIDKGTTCAIPVWGLQMDPEYFPEPEKFNPDRFKPENKEKIKYMSYMPFGDGPRQCLGLRFGLMQSKAGLASLINKYNFTLNKKTPYPPKFCETAFILTVEGGIWLNATKAD